jgi:hypothetical protein
LSKKVTYPTILFYHYLRTLISWTFVSFLFLLIIYITKL